MCAKSQKHVPIKMSGEPDHARRPIRPVPAPFVSSVMRIEPQWIDYNGHLNVAYYNVLFDRAVEEVYELIGLGPDYLKRHRHSTFVAEAHVRYLRELHEGDPVRVTSTARLRRQAHSSIRGAAARDRWVSATCENMTLHVTWRPRRSRRFPKALCAAGGDEDGACGAAAAGSCGAQHRDAGAVMRSIFPPAWRHRRARWYRSARPSARF